MTEIFSHHTKGVAMLSEKNRLKVRKWSGCVFLFSFSVVAVCLLRLYTMEQQSDFEKATQPYRIMLAICGLLLLVSSRVYANVLLSEEIACDEPDDGHAASMSR